MSLEWPHHHSNIKYKKGGGKERKTIQETFFIEAQVAFCSFFFLVGISFCLPNFSFSFLPFLFHEGGKFVKLPYSQKPLPSSSSSSSVFALRRERENYCVASRLRGFFFRQARGKKRRGGGRGKAKAVLLKTKQPIDASFTRRILDSWLQLEDHCALLTESWNQYVVQ